jgi:hypothetical protein
MIRYGSPAKTNVGKGQPNGDLATAADTDREGAGDGIAASETENQRGEVMVHPQGESLSSGPKSRPPAQRTLRYADETIAQAYLELHRGNFSQFIALHRSAGIAPARDQVISWARRMLWRGELDAALEAFAAVHARPRKEDLLACVSVCEERHDSTTASRAQALAMNSQ